MKQNNENAGGRRVGNINRIQILQIEDEVEYIINSIDFVMDPEAVSNSVSLILFQGHEEVQRPQTISRDIPMLKHGFRGSSLHLSIQEHGLHNLSAL